MMLIDEDGLPAPADGPGEMVFHGDSFIAGYWQRPEASPATVEGRVAALGRHRPRRCRRLRLLRRSQGRPNQDRWRDRLLPGGRSRVAARARWWPRSQLLAFLTSCGVRHCGPASNVRLRRRAQAITTARQRFTSWHRTRLSGFKVPKRVVFFDQLPRTALGKLAVGDIRALAIDSSATNCVAER